MDIPSLSFTPRWEDISTKLFIDTMLAHDRLKFGVVVDGVERPSASKLRELCVGYDVVSQKHPSVDNLGCDVKIVLRGAAVAEFFRTGNCGDLEWVLHHTVRPIYDAVQFDLPAEPVEHDPNLWLKSLCSMPLPAVFRVEGVNRELFEIAAKYQDAAAIPLQPLRRELGDLRIPPPYRDRPNGYAVDLHGTTPEEFGSVLRLMDASLPRDTADFVWLDLTWGGPWERLDIPGLLQSYYSVAARHFERAL